MNVAAQIQNQVKVLMSDLNELNNAAQQTQKSYWATDANVKVAAVADSATPVTVSSRLTKAQFLAGVGLCEQIGKFFANQATSQADNCATMLSLHIGNDAASAVLSEATEHVGNNMVNLCETLISIHKKSRELIAVYWGAELGAAVAAISDSTIVFGGNVTKSQILSAVTLMDNLNKFCENSQAATADYGATIAKWAIVPLV